MRRWIISCKHAGYLAAVCLTLAAAPAAAVPTVDGVVFGSGIDADGVADIDEYILYDTSVNGSNLYIYLDVPNNTLYAALVVDRAVNDNVFGPNPAARDYARSGGVTGWGSARNASNLTNSEFAEFTFECAQGGAVSFQWKQGYACQVNNLGVPTAGTGVWESDADAGCAGADGDATPVGLTSASSFMYNMNQYDTSTPLSTAGKPWNLAFYGTTLGDWVSPFEGSTPTTVQISDGSYPTTGQIGFSSIMGYEWPMVYEWSVDLTAAGCGTNNIFVVTGLSHHSPSKIEGVENDEFDDPPDEPLSDLGDLPDSYATLVSSNGPRHHYSAGGPILGSLFDVEPDGKPSADADGDDTASSADEDGINLIVNSNWEEGTTQDIEVTTTGPGVLGAWFDWNGDGDFDDPGEFFTTTVATGTQTLTDFVTVGNEYQYESEVLNARFRLFSSAAAAPSGGVSLAQSDYAGVGTDGEVEDYTYEVGSLPVTLNFFKADKRGNSIRFDWGTATETATVGFHFWGRIDGEWQQLNEQIYLNQGTDSLTPQSYKTSVTPAGSNLPGGVNVDGIDAFGISSVDTDGTQHFYGPFEPGKEYGEVATPDPIPWDDIQVEVEQNLASQGYAKQGNRWRKDVKGNRGKGKGGNGENAGSNLSVQSTAAAADDIVYLETEEPGIHRVSYADLQAAGVDLMGVSPERIAVTHKGESVARYVSANPGLGFGPGDYIEFIARAVDEEDRRYTRTNVYQVELDPALVVASEEINERGKGQAPSYYIESVERDVNKWYGWNMPVNEPWYEHRLVGVPGGFTGAATVDLSLDNLVQGVNDPRVKVRLGMAGITFFADGPDDHRLRVYLNNTQSPLADLTNDGVVDWQIDLPVLTSQLAEGVNTVKVDVPGVQGHVFDLIYGDTYGIDYPRAYVARNDTLTFTEQAGIFELDGFSSNEVVAYASTGDDDLRRLKVRTGKAAGDAQVEIPGLADRTATYWVATRGAVKTPNVANVGPSADLASEPADYVIVAHAHFIDALESSGFIDAKRSQGFDVKIVEVGRIFDHYGHGFPVPSGIRAYLQAQEAAGEIEHVLIVGGGTTDPLNYIGSNSIDYVPTYFAKTGSIIYHAPADGLTVDLHGPTGPGSEPDGIPDKSVGRWPVRTIAELDTLVDKTLAYQEDMADDRTALLVADASDPDLPSFAEQTRRIGDLLANPGTGTPWTDFTEVFLDDFPSVSSARQALVQAINAGQAMTVFSGHASPTGWTFDPLMSWQTAQTLSNAGKPTMVATISCYTSYWVSPSTNTIGHQLLLSGDRGAAVIHGAATLSSFRDNEELLGRATTAMADYESVGQAVLGARQSLGKNFHEVVTNWSLLGDPSLNFKP